MLICYIKCPFVLLERHLSITRKGLPIVTADWTAREELGLLDGIETFGLLHNRPHNVTQN